MPVFQLSDTLTFPPPHLADPSGLLAIGGDLSRQRLLQAYRQGIFPWYSAEDPTILWWCPSPRLVLYPTELKVSKSLKKMVKKQIFRITFDQAFEQVISACAQDRRGKREGTWITPSMALAYMDLHRAGYAHSVEAWESGRLAGGLYGVALGRCFFGESMFTRVSNASKVALVHLVKFLIQHGFALIDCQVTSEHLITLGAREIPRSQFLRQLRRSLERPGIRGAWQTG